MCALSDKYVWHVQRHVYAHVAEDKEKKLTRDGQYEWSYTTIEYFSTITVKVGTCQLVF